MSRTCLAHVVVSPLLSLGSTRFPLSRLCSCVSRFLHISSSSASSRTSRPASCFAELSCGWLAGCAAVVCGVWRCCGSSMRHVPVGQPTLSHCDTHLFIYIYIYIYIYTCVCVFTCVYVRVRACVRVCGVVCVTKGKRRERLRGNAASDCFATKRCNDPFHKGARFERCRCTACHTVPSRCQGLAG